MRNRGHTSKVKPMAANDAAPLLSGGEKKKNLKGKVANRTNYQTATRRWIKSRQRLLFPTWLLSNQKRKHEPLLADSITKDKPLLRVSTKPEKNKKKRKLLEGLKQLTLLSRFSSEKKYQALDEMQELSSNSTSQVCSR